MPINLNDKLAFLRALAKSFGGYLDKSKPLEEDVHARIEDSIKLFNKVLERADTKANDQKTLDRVDEIYTLYTKSGCKNSDEFAIYYIENLIFSKFKKIYKTTDSQFTGSVSIAHKISVVEALDFEHPSKIDWINLLKNGALVFDEDYSPVFIKSTDLFVDHKCVLSEAEYWKSNELCSKLSSAWVEYCFLQKVAKPLLALQIEKEKLLDKFNSSTDELERANLRFAIGQIEIKAKQYMRWN